MAGFAVGKKIALGYGATYRTVAKAMEHYELARLIENGEIVNTERPVQHPMTMNDVGLMKAICDTYLITTFRTLIGERVRPGQPQS